MDIRRAFGKAGRPGCVCQRPAAGGDGAEVALARRDRRFGSLSAAAQLHAGDSVAVCVQRFLRNERHGLLEGRNHYQQGRPLHGMENQGRRL